MTASTTIAAIVTTGNKKQGCPFANAKGRLFNQEIIFSVMHFAKRIEKERISWYNRRVIISKEGWYNLD